MKKIALALCIALNATLCAAPAAELAISLHRDGYELTGTGDGSNLCKATSSEEPGLEFYAFMTHAGSFRPLFAASARALRHGQSIQWISNETYRLEVIRIPLGYVIVAAKRAPQSSDSNDFPLARAELVKLLMDRKAPLLGCGQKV
jgi:hypothetical protein